MYEDIFSVKDPSQYPKKIIIRYNDRAQTKFNKVKKVSSQLLHLVFFQVEYRLLFLRAEERHEAVQPDIHFLQEGRRNHQGLRKGYLAAVRQHLQDIARRADEDVSRSHAELLEVQAEVRFSFFPDGDEQPVQAERVSGDGVRLFGYPIFGGGYQHVAAYSFQFGHCLSYAFDRYTFDCLFHCSCFADKYKKNNLSLCSFSLFTIKF